MSQSSLAQEAVEAGKVKYLGVSEMAPADVRRAHKIHPISLIELEWSLLSRDAEASPAAQDPGFGSRPKARCQEHVCVALALPSFSSDSCTACELSRSLQLCGQA